jgi:hypothetical protein
MGHIVKTVKRRQKTDPENGKEKKGGESIHFEGQGKNSQVFKGAFGSGGTDEA